MEPSVKTKNVRGAEAILRPIIGIILIIFFLSIGRIVRWIFGLIGVAFILAAIFGCRPWKGYILKVFGKEG